MSDKSLKVKPYIHTTYFQLVDSSADLKSRFVKACIDYLSNHKGQTRFSISTRVLTATRNVNNQDYTLVVDMTFKEENYFQKYTQDPRHEQFITEVAGMCLDRFVCDSYQDLILNL